MKFDHMVKHNGKYFAAGMEVPVAAPIRAELTNNVPDGALETNADGSINAYDAEGNVVGTVSTEEVVELQEQAGEAFAEQDKPKRGRKSKEE